MALPINIKELLNGKTVESERIELKEGWNPKKVLHSICAFANDLNNWGGGYIIVGVKESNGKPVFPLVGLNENQIDEIQKELLQYGKRKIEPAYIPVVEPVEFQGKMILVIWVPMGVNRPYKASDDLGKGSQQSMYVRRTSNSVLADTIEASELNDLSRRVPFVEQPNHGLSIDVINRQLIVDYLKEVGSSMAEESKSMSLAELCSIMKIVHGPDEMLVPKNIGLLFFTDKPSDYFYKARIDVVLFKNEDDDIFDEKIFEGPLHIQVKNALKFIKDDVVIERVQKIPNEAKANRYYNFPYEAIEETLVNAVYHKSYQSNEPIEVRIYRDKIIITSFPGPLPPLSKESFDKESLPIRQYRNGRVGDFLKEIHLTEARGTGIRKIKRVLKQNGSPVPEFDTDADRVYFSVTLNAHLSFSFVKGDVSENELVVLNFCMSPRKREEILSRLDLSNETRNFKRHLLPMVEKGWVEMTIPEKPRSKYQKYLITDLGQQIIDFSDLD